MNFLLFTVLISLIALCTKQASSLSSAAGDNLQQHKQHCRYTVGNRGSRKNTACDFPFVFNGKTYDGVCTNDKDPAGEYWCSTKVNRRNRKHIGGKGHWGYCRPGCDTKPKITTIQRSTTTTTQKPTTPATRKPTTSRNTVSQFPTEKPKSNYWDKSIRELKEENNLSGNWYHWETASGDYLPNEYDSTCGQGLAFGNIFWFGEIARFGAYPYIAALGYRRKGKVSYSCGGSLINRRYVITAAHCHSTSRKSKQIEEVVIGDYDLSTDPDCDYGNCEKPVQRFTIYPNDVTVHENWNQYKVVNEGYDIALIRLPKAAYTVYEKVGASVLPICLPWGKLPNGNTAILPKGQKGKEYTVTGWGRTNNNRTDKGDKDEGGAHTNLLMKLDLPHIETGWCKSNPQWGAFHRITSDRQVCAGGTLHKDSCSGESGGPLMVQAQRKITPMYLKGIDSFGTRQCGKGFPGVYTDVGYYIDWIKRNMKP